MVEARGVEPLSEDRQHTASTCVADNLDSQPSTPIGRLRTAASPEQSRPQPLSTGLGPARCIALSHPRGPQMEERHSLIKLRVPVLDWQLHFPGVYESPRARHATVVSVSPSKPVAPLSLEDDENGFQLCSRSCEPCDAPKTVRLGCLVARALLEPILIILRVAVSAIGSALSHMPS
jgi:hypothetical protein